MLSQKTRDVSAYIFNELSQQSQVEALKMQKLMYYAKGWSLALQNNPLFEDKCEAWKHGPVISGLYSIHAGLPILPVNWDTVVEGNAENIDGFDKKIIDFVISKYGAMSGWGLRNLTHTETPWKKAWEESGMGSKHNFEIDDQYIKKYFQSLISK